MIKKNTMNQSLFFSTIVVAGVLLNLANAAVTITDAPNVNDPVCPHSGDENVGDQSATSSTSIDDYIASSSHYAYQNSDYIQTMVKAGDSTNPFKFLYFDANSIKQEIACTGTEGYQFVRLINNMLFLKQTSPQERYRVCKFSLASALTSVTGFSDKNIVFPTGLNRPFTKVIPYSVKETTPGSEWAIQIAFKKGTVVRLVRYAWTTISSSKTDLTATITGTMTQMDGVEDVIYNDVDGFAILGGTTYAANTARLPKPAPGSTVVFYRTLTRTSLIGVYPTATTASFYLVRYSTQLDITALTDITGTSTAPFMDFFDESSNIMIVSTTQVAWINVAKNDAMLKVIATSTEIPVENLQSVGFYWKTAVFTYTSKLVVYQMKGNDSLEKTYSHTTASSIPGQGGSRTVALSCFCRVLTHLGCYSSTLNCLLIKKGNQICQVPPASIAQPTVVLPA